MLIVLIIICQQSVAQPYVFYKRNKITVETLDSPIVKTETFPIAEKENHKVQVNFPGNEGWNFTVNLKTIEIDPVEFNAADTILFLSDMEGQFELLRELLIANNVMNDKYEWTFGHGQLIICGDLFDRGTQVTQQLWLLYKLESVAAANGGSVHVLLGNHEIMNLSGDLRYMDAEYYEHARLLDRDYVELFNENTELGRWLRSKNIILKAGPYLCVHGGISKEVLNKKMNIKSINELVRPWYDKWKQDVPEYVSRFFDENSPFWYRGYFDEPMDKQKLVDATLEKYKVEKIIVGHTIRKMIASYYNGKVWDINTDWHSGNAQGLLVEKDKFYRVDNKGNKAAFQ